MLKNIRNKEDGENDRDGGDKVASTSLSGTFQVSTIMKHSNNSETPFSAGVCKKRAQTLEPERYEFKSLLSLVFNILAEHPRTTFLTKAFHALKLGDYIYPPSL